jgi:uncharacterized protein YacL
MSWLDKYPTDTNKSKRSKNYYILIALLLIASVLTIYYVIHYLVGLISTKVSQMVVQSTGAAGSGLVLSVLISKLLPFFIAFRAILKILKTLFFLFFVFCLFLLYLNIKHPEVFKSLVSSFS